MTIGTLSSPGTASFQLTLLDNGKLYAPPPHTDYVFDATFTSPDTTVVIEQDKMTANLFRVTIPSGEKSTAVTFNASAVAPDGSLISAQVPLLAQPTAMATTTAKGVNTVTLPLKSVEQKYSIDIKQTE